MIRRWCEWLLCPDCPDVNGDSIDEVIILIIKAADLTLGYVHDLIQTVVHAGSIEEELGPDMRSN